MKNKDQTCRKVIEFGVIGLVVFSPLPAASVHEWSILVIQLTAIALTIIFFGGIRESRDESPLSNALRWPKYLFVGFWIIIIFQLIPFPKWITRILSPNTYAFHELHAPDFSSVKFMSLSLVPAHSFKTALALLSYFLIGFLIVKTITRRSQILRMFFVIYFMGIFEAVSGLLQLRGFNPYAPFFGKITGLEYVSGSFVNRNHFAGYLEMIIPVSLGLIFAQFDLFSFSRMKWKEKLVRLSDRNVSIALLLLFGMILMCLSLVFTRSRSAVFVLIFVFILFFFLIVWRSGQNKEQKKSIRIFLVSFFCIILLLSLLIGMDTTLKRFSLETLSQESRPRIWAETLKIFSGYPVFGSGLGTFAALFPNMEGDGRLAKVSHAHNDYLEYLSETGVLGAAFIIGGIFVIFFGSFKFWQQRRHPMVRGLGLGGIVAIVAILAHGVTDFNLHIPSNMLLFSVILSLTLVTVTYKRSKNEA